MIFGSRAHGLNSYLRVGASALALTVLTSYAAATPTCLNDPPETDESPEALCRTLAEKLPYENVTTTYQPAGSVMTIDTTGCTMMLVDKYTAISNFCRVQVTVPTSNRSEVELEAWLPDASVWNGRFLALGNGGLMGCIWYPVLNSYAGETNIAVVNTNNGHRGDTAEPMLNNEDVLIDFASRALVVEHDVGLEITTTYYSRKPDYKYYEGCSMGGRQGFVLAQEYPEFYDGIIAGAPALDFIVLAAYFAKLGKLMGVKTIPDNSKLVLGVDDLPIVTKAVLDQCDGLDGLKNGIIDDPDQCNFKPEKIQCSKAQLANGNTTGVCLTPQQVSIVREIFSPMRGENGEIIYSRWDPGMTSSVPYAFGYNLGWAYTLQVFHNIIYNDTSFTIENFTEADTTFARKLNPANLATWNTNLGPFKKHGGKILSYHGTADGIIPSTNILRYREEVKKTISPHDPNSFWKHYVIPGMDHCSGSTTGSDAPWNFAQMLAPSGGLKNDSDHKILLTLIDWVENGSKKGPESIVGTKFVDDDASKGVAAQRTYCAYPKKSVLKRKGADPKKAESWKCV